MVLCIWYTLVLLLLVLPLQALTAFTPCNETFGIKWSPSWASEPRNDLRCGINSHCTREPTQVEYKQFDKCCVCNSCAIWEGTETDFFIEYVSMLGRSLVFVDQALTNPDAVYKIDHTSSEMTEMPSNLCNWDTDMYLNERFSREFDSLQLYSGNIVQINFENNKIQKIGNLNCLFRLDLLNLRNNRITHVSNTSFTNLTRLRFIDFSNNLIQKLDPGILTSVHLNLFFANFSNNKMSEIDVSNMLSLYPFCNIYFSSNEITHMVNKANFKLEMKDKYGPGYIHFVGNEFKTWPNFQELFQLDDLSQMGHLLSLGFDFREIPIICDCNLEPFMSLADDVIGLLWRDYMNVTCTAPEDLAGIPVGKVETNRFICNLTAEQGCPAKCTCTDKPNENTLQVDCSFRQGIHHEHLPAKPESKISPSISLNFSNQHLTDITDLLFVSNISMLDVSNNTIKEITNDVAKALENATFIDLSDNSDLRTLPKVFLQYRNVCSTNMKNLKINCDCDSIWIDTWLHSKTCINEDYMFECILPSGERKPALSFTAADIDCSPRPSHTREYVISGAIAFLIITGTFIYSFRYELLILYARIKQQGRNSSESKYKYDVFLSYNDTDVSVQKWIRYKLEEALVNAGYRVFQPICDVTFGAERDSEVRSTICNTRNFLLVLTDDYLAQVEEGMRPWTENEWKYGWYNFITDRSKNIVLVNFDHVSSFDVLHPQMKAFLRVGCTVDFKNRNRNIMEDIFKELGKPYMQTLRIEKGFENKKTKFQNNEFLTTNQNQDKYHYEDFYIDKDTGHVRLPSISTVTKKLNPSVPAVTNQIYTFSRQSNIKHHEEKENAQKGGRFSCYYGDHGFKKTPHIPVFKKQQHSNTFNQTSSQSPPNGQNLENLLKFNKTYNYKTTTLDSTLNHPKNHFLSHSADEQTILPPLKYLKPLTKDLQNHSTELEYFDSLENDEELLRLNMSETFCESQASISSNTDDLESVSGSEYSNTLCTSMGSARSSFCISFSTGSLTDVSV